MTVEISILVVATFLGIEIFLVAVLLDAGITHIVAEIERLRKDEDAS